MPLVRVSLLVLVVSLSAVFAADGEIRWQGGHVFPATPMSSGDLEAALGRLAARAEARHVVVQLDRPLDARDRRSLADAGVELLSPLGGTAWFARLEPGSDPGRIVTAASGVLARVSPVGPLEKLHPDLAAGIVRPWTIVPAPDPEAEKGKPESVVPEVPIVAVTVLFHRDVDLDRDADAIARRHGGRVMSAVRSLGGVVVHLRADRVAELAGEDAVMWVEPPLPPMSEVNDSNRARVGADIVNAPPYGLNGAGVQVLVYDGGKVFAHGDFASRLTIGASDTSGISDHATHVAGTIGGDGSGSAGLYRGMAPGVGLISYGFEMPGGLEEGFLYTDPGDLEADYTEAITLYGADISNNSIGTNTAANGFPCEWEGNYGVTEALIDAIARGSVGAPFRIVWANGNERGSGRCGTTYVTTAPPACGKNHITIGAMNSNDDSVTSFTSWGPCDDGRLKPDVSAPGCQVGADNGVTSASSAGGYGVKCGTSMASPTACGVGALVLQAYRQTFPAVPDFRNSTLKAILANTATDLETAGPDYKTGYGSIRVQPAVDAVLEGRFLEAEVAQGETYAFLVLVDAGDPQLSVTVAWDDPPGTPNVNPVLVNDLDLRVIGPSGQTAWPWTLDPQNPANPAVRTQRDGVNNIEQVRVDSPEPGAWRVEVTGFNITDGITQSFGAAASPSLVNCSDDGNLSADRNRATCNAQLGLRVIDCDLNTSDAVVDTTSISVTSGSEPAGESVLLTESAPESAAFLGSIGLAPVDAPGVLRVVHGDVVTATYVDADDGVGGTNVSVIDQVTIDCVAPSVLAVAALEVNPRDALIGVTTGEAARVTIEYGTSCGALTGSETSFAFATDHSVRLRGLSDDQFYAYAVVATDEAGNVTRDDNGGACHGFVTPEVPDFFTEQFTAGLDLVNKALTFTPGHPIDFYVPCLESLGGVLPTDPTGGTALTGLDDDQPVSFTLGGGATVSLYGQTFSTIWVGPNGYLTFGSGDSTYNEAFAAHFSKPRVAAVFDDLNPETGGSISWKQTTDRVAVTWSGIPEYNTSNSNTFQIEMFFDGRIRISWLAVAVQDAIAGLSEGLGVDPGFAPSDLSATASCGPRPPYVQDFGVTTSVNVPVSIVPLASDDGLPAPPGAMEVRIVRLPDFGTIVDDGTGLDITSVPHVLVGPSVTYEPLLGTSGFDSFGYLADDSGVPPLGGESRVATAGVTIVAPPIVAGAFLVDNTNPGWTGTGQWQFGHPTGGGSHNGDPDGGATGTNVYGYNLAGDYPNNMGVETLTSGPINLTGVSGTYVQFQRWLGIESSTYDHASFQVSTNGTTWTTVWQHTGASVDQNAWTLESYDVSALVDGQGAVRLRWTMGTTDVSVTYPGWNIDDVRVLASPPSLCVAKPAEVSGFAFDNDRRTLRWNAAAHAGGDSPVYDVLRTGAPDDLLTGATCVVSDTAAMSTVDLSTPAPGDAYYYVVRAENSCGVGSAGLASDGSERDARACP